MVVMVIMTMMVAVMIILTVVIIVRMLVRRVSAALGLERSFDARGLAAKRDDERLQGVVAGKPNAIGEDLDRHMTIAERPGQPRQRRQVGTRLDQRLGRGDDLDDVAVVELHEIVGAQRDRLAEIEGDRRALGGAMLGTLRAPLVCGEDERVDGRRVRLTGRKNFDRARHGQLRRVGRSSG